MSTRFWTDEAPLILEGLQEQGHRRPICLARLLLLEFARGTHLRL
jgi:hypothetical protein